MTVRYYSATAQETTLQVGINNSATVIQVAATTGFPVSLPYLLALDYESATEEVVLVTGAAGTSLTVTRAYDGTSAAAHSSGARVRHVSSAIDFRDSRDHENATDGIHGLAPTDTIVGEDATQTLNNKTLASPAITGTVTGQPTFSGDPIFTGTGTNNVLETRTTGDTQPRVAVKADGQIVMGSGSAATDWSMVRTAASTAEVTGTLGFEGSVTGDLSVYTEVTGDTSHRFLLLADGQQQWGSGTAIDTFLFRSAPAELTVADDLVVTTDLTVGGSASVTIDLTVNDDLTVFGDLSVDGIGQTLFARKSADTSRPSTTTLTADPHLSVNVVSGATYTFEAQLFVSSNAAGADINVGFGGTSAGTIKFSGAGAHNTVGAGSNADGEWITRSGLHPIGTGIPYGTSTTGGVTLGATVRGNIVTTGSGTFNVVWAQNTSNATPTILELGSTLTLRRVA